MRSADEVHGDHRVEQGVEPVRAEDHRGGPRVGVGRHRGRNPGRAQRQQHLDDPRVGLDPGENELAEHKEDYEHNAIDR